MEGKYSFLPSFCASLWLLLAGCEGGAVGEPQSHVIGVSASLLEGPFLGCKRKTMERHCKLTECEGSLIQRLNRIPR